jgi:DNA-binding NarL/FixJ family response regulator
VNPFKLLKRVTNAHRGQVRVEAARRRRPKERRLLQVFVVVPAGKASPTASELKIDFSEQTVKNHLQNIYNKLRIRNRVQLVRAVLSASA